MNFGLTIVPGMEYHVAIKCLATSLAFSSAYLLGDSVSLDRRRHWNYFPEFFRIRVHTCVCMHVCMCVSMCV